MRKPKTAPKPELPPDHEPYLIGYARVRRRPTPTTDRRAHEGRRPCEPHLSGAGIRIWDSQAPAIDLMMKDARAGDVVVVWKLDRLGRNVRQVLDTFHELTEKGGRGARHHAAGDGHQHGHGGG